jgi:hypothetical protein
MTLGRGRLLERGAEEVEEGVGGRWEEPVVLEEVESRACER